MNVEGCFLGMLELGVFPLHGRFGCVLALLHVWYYDMEPTPLSSVLLLLSACSMARGQEETSTSQVGHKRGPGRDMPSASSIISSLSMEELRSYCHIPDNIDLELPDGLAESTIDKEDDAVLVHFQSVCLPDEPACGRFLIADGQRDSAIQPYVLPVLSTLSPYLDANEGTSLPETGLLDCWP